MNAPSSMKRTEDKPSDPEPAIGSVTRPTIAAVSPDQLRWRCPKDWLPFETTASVDPATSIIGQDDAAEAVRFGLTTRAPGHHIYVRGVSGTGRIGLVQQMMSRVRPRDADACDHCLVRNFERPDRPLLITLPRGGAARFASLLDAFAQWLDRDFRKAMDAQSLQAERIALDESLSAAAEKLTAPFEAEVEAAGLIVLSDDDGGGQTTRLVATIDGKPTPPEAIDELVAAGTLTEERAEELAALVESFEERLAEIAVRLDELRERHDERVRSLLQRQVRAVVRPRLARAKREFSDGKLHAFLDAAVEDLSTRRLEAFVTGEKISRLYRVNPIVTHPTDDACPIVLESTPSLTNLFGSVEREWSESGTPQTDHLLVRPGSILRADGGFLIIEAQEILREPDAWRALVRALRTGKVDFPSETASTPWTVRSLHPESIPLNTKIVLVGDSNIHAVLDQLDPDFSHLFKVLADLESDLPRTPESVALYAQVLARISADEKLLPFARSAVAELVEHGARIAGGPRRITARFGRIGDVAREAAFVAAEAGVETIDAKHVTEAIRRGRRRADLPARRYRDRLADGTIRVQLKGDVVGQINGLAVIHAGPLIYGFPQRITATVSPGRTGVINIEREADLSGSIHTKAFYILGGLLRELLRPEHPVAFDASIAFEQSYGGIDGDSASCAEMCCLLSALTSVPIRQSLAITGAIDQKGNVMTIGAVNEKIEGFHDTCAAMGLTGAQGVLIPASNVSDLALRPDVVEACAAGRFSVLPIERIEDAIELLFAIDDPDGDGVAAHVLKRAVARMLAFWRASAHRPEPPKPDASATPD